MADTLQTDTARRMHAVEVAAQRYTSPLRTGTGGTKRWQMSALHELPQVMGNTDPLHMAEMLPGIQTTSEYDSGLHIWGGDNGHNEVSVDGTVLYGVQHLLGLFSVFNSSHFESMTYSPAASLESSSNRIGGLLRMESYGQVPPRLTGELSVGPMSSQGTLRLPMGRKTALFVSAREAYLNLLYSRWLKIDDEQYRYSFGDYNLTLLHHFSPRDKLRIHGYWGHDRMGLDTELLQGQAQLRWGNQMATIDYQHSFGEKGQLAQAVSFSRYASRLALKELQIDFQLPASVMDIGYRGSLAWQQWDFRLDASLQRIRPQSPELAGANHVAYQPAQLQQVVQLSADAGYSFRLPKGWLLRPTLKAFLYWDDCHTLHGRPAPSLLAEWQTRRAGTFSLHYAWQHQALFQTGITDMGFPVEFWVAAGRYGSPQAAQHLSLSHHIVLGNNRWELSTSLYYKRLYNQLEYDGNLLDMLNTRYELQNCLLAGEGESYGVNIMLTRRTGPVTGWVSYAYSRSRRRFQDARHAGTYPSRHERPHEVNGVISWRISKHWSVASTFVFCSGTPYTPVEYIYLFNHAILVQRGDFNSKRLKPYKRIDLSVNYDFTRSARRDCGLNLSLYNAFGFSNELYYRLRIHKGAYSYRPKGFLLPVLPSLSFYYRWK